MKTLLPNMIRSTVWGVSPTSQAALIKFLNSPQDSQEFIAAKPLTFSLDLNEDELEFFSKKTTVVDGVAMINISGFMAKDVFPFFGANTKIVQRQLRAALANDQINSILLVIDSPGGDFKGQIELAETIRQTDKIKPVFAFISDEGASAAFWAAISARRVFANEAAEVGSIGTFAVLIDASERFEKEGVKVIVVSSGDMKGQGVFGTKISDKLIAFLTKRIDEINEFFLKAVMVRRKMNRSEVEKVATGETFMAKTAKSLGLIDEIASLETTIDFSINFKRRSGRTRRNSLSLQLLSEKYFS